ncbi:RidA family protein [Euzebya sp.]|uniref:RidA family protein n=1 Tax=Euzebya sp. TaxID=1971409 RepID=UPI003516F0E7
MSTPEQRLADAGIELPEAPAPAAAYVPWRRSGDLVFTAGQIPVRGGSPTITGRLGEDVSLAQGQDAARECAVNVLAQLKAAVGELTFITKLVKITVFVASAPEFTDQHLVANGASELFAQVLGEGCGSHARSAVGVAVLPLGVPVEVEAVAQVEG